MTVEEQQERPIPAVPVGTPGRDSRAELPAPLPPGAQQPWRRSGPGNRAWVVVVTSIAVVAMVVLGVFAVTFGFATTAFERKGAVVLSPSEYRASSSACTGFGSAAAVKKGAKVRFSGHGTSFEAALGEGALRSGRCVFSFTLSALDANATSNYAVTVGGVDGTPVSGAELTSSSGSIVVYVASN